MTRRARLLAAGSAAVLALATLAACGSDNGDRLVGYQISPAPKVGHLTRTAEMTVDSLVNDLRILLNRQWIGRQSCVWYHGGWPSS